MTKQEFYRELCIEAGTHDGATDANDWYDECGHNISCELDEALQRAADGDVSAIVEARDSCGLRLLV